PPNANFAGAVVSIIGSKVNVFQPDPSGDCRLDLQAEAVGSKGCRWSIPIIADDGTPWAMTNTGEGFRFTSADPITPLPALAVLAISPDGALKWRSPDAKGLTTIPVIGSDGMVYWGSQDHRLYAIDPKSPAAFAWSFPTGGATTSPAIGVDGTIYFGSADEY